MASATAQVEDDASTSANGTSTALIVCLASDQRTEIRVVHITGGTRQTERSLARRKRLNRFMIGLISEDYFFEFVARSNPTPNMILSIVLIDGLRAPRSTSEA